MVFRYSKFFGGGFTNIYTLCWAFAYDPYFLTLFYRRLNDGHRIMKLLKEDSSSLHLYCSDIGRNLTMHHPFSTIVNAKRLGDGCTIKNNITIGNRNEDNSLTPTIGNNVLFGANCVVFGDITIGNNVIIGAGAVVNKSVPDNCIVVGNPMRIILRRIDS